MTDEEIKYFDISTYIYHGQVYLVGEYDTVDQKNQAVKLAGQVEGAKSVTSFFCRRRKTIPAKQRLTSNC
jgi:osmotically-inducible protein OsmY